MALDERTRAYRILRNVAANILMYGEEDGSISMTDFQSLFLTQAFTPNPFSRQTMENINKGDRFLNLPEAEQLVTYLMTAVEDKKYYQVVVNEKIDERTGKKIEYKEIICYREKSIENYDRKKEIFDSVLTYFYELHNITQERIQELLERRHQQNTSTNENRYQVINPVEITEKDIEEAIDLDKVGYGGVENYIGVRDTCIDWANANPFIYFMIRDKKENKIVGYVNAMPVTNELYKKLAQDEIDDINISPNDILSYNMPGNLNLYFASIVVTPKTEDGQKILGLLFSSIQDFFIKLSENNIIVKKMLAKEVSGKGKRLCKLFGMVQSDNNESIYEVSLYPPEFDNRFPFVSTLFDCYQKHYEEHKND